MPLLTKLSQWLFKPRTNRRGNLDDEFLESYRKLLFGQYQGMNGPIDDPAAKQEAESVIQQWENTHTVSWEDLYRLELAIIKLEPIPLLERRTWILRQEYKEIASPDEVKDYYLSDPPNPKKAEDGDLLRPDCVRIQEELNWRYVVIWLVEEFRGKLTRGVVGITIFFLLVALLFCSPTVEGLLGRVGLNINLEFLAVIVLPGVLGGLISTLRRIQTVKLNGNADLALTQLQQNNLSILLSPFYGGIFAFLLFCLLAGSFVSGNLFPNITFDHLWGGAGLPADSGELAKLIIWCFIAGFSETFVPDRLDQLSKQKGQGTPTGTPATPRNSTTT